MKMVGIGRAVPALVIAGALTVGAAAGGASAALLITGKQIKDNTVTTKDIKNGTLKKKDMSSKAIEALEGATGSAGPAGAPGISGYQLVSNSVSVAADSGGKVAVACPVGKRLLSGASSFGAGYDGTHVDVDISTTGATATGWNYLAVSDTLTIEVICAIVS